MVGTTRPERCFALNRCPGDIYSAVSPYGIKKFLVERRKIRFILMITHILCPVAEADGRKGYRRQAKSSDWSIKLHPLAEDIFP